MSGKRKTAGGQAEQAKRARKPEAEPPKKKNSALYITNLPRDVTYDELEQAVSRFGLVAEDISTGKKRIRIYTDDDGTPKGDALIVFFRAESVQLAVDMLDDTDFRPGQANPQGRIKVQEADYSFKVEKEAQPIQQRSAKEKREILKSVQKLNSKLADWDDDDVPQQANGRWRKVVILKHVFTLKELDEDVTAALDIKEDIREGCEEIGPVTNVTLYDLEEDGVVSVRFQNADDAEECVDRMDGRFFGGRRITATIYDGEVRYRKAKKAAPAGLDDDADRDEQDRLEKFGEWLEADES
ncbi:uncharacterized protein V1510DRAFT_409846 [Dipodascopsis tothii]|uniref:uncharacterized protein n=1 Tax=Dipodascopsis tothii TaxID=44089 RepID=UPI0034CEE956